MVEEGVWIEGWVRWLRWGGVNSFFVASFVVCCLLYILISTWVLGTSEACENLNFLCFSKD